MVNVGYIHSVAAIGGAERVTETLARSLPKDQFKSFFFCAEDGKMVQAMETLDTKARIFEFYQPGWSSPLETLKSYRVWSKHIKADQIDILHSADLQCTRSALLGSGSTPLLCHVHFPFEADYANWIFKGLPKPAAFVFCSEELKNDVGPILESCCPSSKQFVVHNGVELTDFSTKQPTNPIKRIGIIANLQERKGHDDFLQMAKIVSNEYPHVHFDIIGGDILQEPREPHLKSLCAALGLDEFVTFHGQIPNVKAELEALDIFVCASHQEAFPISILEAMAAAKPIVSTNVNGIPEAIIDNECGYLVEKKSPEQLASKVVALLKDPLKAEQMGQSARKRVEDNFSREVFAQKFQTIYRELIG